MKKIQSKNYCVSTFLVTLLFVIGLTESVFAASPVTWINQVNVAVMGNNIAKNGGCEGCADSGATSQQQITSGNGYVEFTATSGSKGYIGLGNTTTNSTSHLDINFGMNFENGSWDVRELGYVYKSDGIYSLGDIFRIALEGTQVKYYKNGSVIYTSSAVPSYPLVVDTSLFLLTAKVDNVVVESGNTSNSCATNTTLITNRSIFPEPALPVLPSAGGKFCDTTFGTEIMRVTDESNCTVGNSCGTEYSVLPSFNSNNTRLLISSSPSGESFVMDFDPNTFSLTGNKRVLPTSVRHSFAQWSNLNPNILYAVSQACSTPKIWEVNINVSPMTVTLVKDFTNDPNFATGDFLDRLTISSDDSVFNMIRVSDCGNAQKGVVTYNKSTNTILLNDPVSFFDGELFYKYEMDKSGSFAVATNVSGTKKVYRNLATGVSQVIANGAPFYATGHGDYGTGTVIGGDNYGNRLLKRDLANLFVFSTILNFTDWTQDLHLSLRANDETWSLVSAYTVDGCLSRNGDLRNEIYFVKNDGTESVLRLAHHRNVHSDCINGSPANGDYFRSPRANISKDGKFIAFTSSWGAVGRTDMFIVRNPTATGTPSPNAPSGLSATTISSSQINLTWTDNSSNETGFKVERSTDNVNFTEILTTAANTTSYPSIGLTASTIYYYRVRATNANGNSIYSSVASATTQANPPVAPASLVASVLSTTSVKLDWVDNSNNETNFLVQRCSGATCTAYVTVAGGTLAPNAITFSSTGLTNGTTYRYRIGATNSAGTNYSGIVTITVGIPAVPATMTATAAAGKLANLTWTSTANNMTNFQVQRCAGTTATCTATLGTWINVSLTIPRTQLTYQDSGLTSGTNYRYRVRAVNGAGNSAYRLTTTTITALP